jgi:hypothetical protein
VFPSNVVKFHKGYPCTIIRKNDNDTDKQLNVVSDTTSAYIRIMRPENRNQTYCVADNYYIQNIKKMGWNIDNGIIELIPAAVIYT